ncbi:SAF domain-containing protein [Nonlabens tegetincola]
MRPGYGLHPKYYESVIGKTVNTDLCKGTPLKLDHIN